MKRTRREGSASRDEIAQQSVGSVEYRNHRAVQRVALCQRASQQAHRTIILDDRDRDDDHVGIKSANELDAEQLEAKRTAGEGFDGAQGGFGGNAQVTQLTGLTAGLAHDRITLDPLELHRCARPAGWRAVEAEIGEAQAFAAAVTRVRLRGRSSSVLREWSVLWSGRLHDGTGDAKWSGVLFPYPNTSEPPERQRRMSPCRPIIAPSYIRRMVLALILLVMCVASPAYTQTPLRDAIAARIARDSGAIVGVAFRDLKTGDTLYMSADESFHAASTMKVPVMIELLRQSEQGALPLDRGVLLVNRFASIATPTFYSLDASSDSDSSLYALIGTRVPARELMRRMITRSSNLATNVLIAMVGADRVNATARRLGATRINVLRGVEDGAAFERGMNNTTTARDLAILLEAIAKPGLLSESSRKEMVNILLAQESHDEIPAGLPPGTKVAHKTGWITGVLHDAAIVYPEYRPPYILVVLTRNIRDDKVARALIADIARLVDAHAAALAPKGGRRGCFEGICYE